MNIENQDWKPETAPRFVTADELLQAAARLRDSVDDQGAKVDDPSGTAEDKAVARSNRSIRRVADWLDAESERRAKEEEYMSQRIAESVGRSASDRLIREDLRLSIHARQRHQRPGYMGSTFDLEGLFGHPPEDY